MLAHIHRASNTIDDDNLTNLYSHKATHQSILFNHSNKPHTIVTSVAFEVEQLGLLEPYQPHVWISILLMALTVIWTSRRAREAELISEWKALQIEFSLPVFFLAIRNELKEHQLERSRNCLKLFQVPTMCDEEASQKLFWIAHSDYDMINRLT